MLTFLIMGGGSGERFWPLSTKQKPKQLLRIFGDKSLIRLTFERVLPLVNKDQIFIATNEVQVPEMKKELVEVDDSRIIIEPAFKDTAAAIAYGSTIISKYYENPIICVLASDHLIADEETFRQIIKIAETQALKDDIVTLGIKPSYPETGYGYIEVAKNDLNIPIKSLGFKEKPQYEKAVDYVNSGKYLWNSGMFIFNYKTIMKALEKYSPNHYETILLIDEKISKNEGIITANKVKGYFDLFEKKSIDFAVMEKADNIQVIPSEFGWNDVGNYLAFEELLNKDENNNVCRNIKCIAVDSNNNILVSDGNYQRLSLLGVKDMIVAISKNEILICDKNKNQEIKKVLKYIWESEC